MRVLYSSLLCLWLLVTPAWADITTGLVLHLRMDEGTGGAGTTIKDSSASNLTATLGAGSANPTWATGTIGPSALDFDAVDDVLTVTQAAAINNVAALTISFWFSFDTRGEAVVNSILNKAPSSNGWILSVDESVVARALRFRAYFSSVMTVRTAVDSLPAYGGGGWTHCMVTWDGSGTATNVHIYLNNVETSYNAQTNGSPSRVDDSANNLLIGNDPGGANTLDGRLDDLRLYTRVLTASDRAELYSYRRPRNTPYWFSRRPGPPTLGTLLAAAWRAYAR